MSILLLAVMNLLPVSPSYGQGAVLSATTYKWSGTPEIITFTPAGLSGDWRPICVGRADAISSDRVTNTQTIACRSTTAGGCPTAQVCFDQPGKGFSQAWASAVK